MERKESVENSSLLAQEVLTRMSNYQQILLLANDMGADRIIIHTQTINI